MQIPLNLLSYDAVQLFVLSSLFVATCWLARRSISHGEKLASFDSRISHIEENDLHDIQSRLSAVESHLGIEKNE